MGVRADACPHRLSAMTDPPNELEPDDQGLLQGADMPLSSPQQRDQALDQAFDYRGDVTIHTTDGRVLKGYVFDRRDDGHRSYIRVIPADGSERINIYEDDITRLVLSGRDTAAGKSWETWVKKHQEKRARGQSASMEPEPLD